MVRFTRRWGIYYRGDVATFPLEAARNLVAQQYADPLPPPVAAREAEGDSSQTSTPTPQRQPGGFVRK
jgi:hypothetical protein